MSRSILTFALLMFVTAGTMAQAAPAASANPQRLVYTIHHSRYGTIGTYSNAVEKTGDGTTVTTEAHIRVSIIGVVLYRQDVSRQERWKNDRLVSFHGITTVNGHPLELTGAAQGDNFMLMSPEGEIVAPANVRLANPWSPDVLHGDTLLTPDRGRMEKVQVKGGEETSVTVNRRAVRAKRYEIDRLDGQKRYEVWLDERGTPVMFTSYIMDAAITFTLTG
jgi:hypothetical protein